MAEQRRPSPLDFGAFEEGGGAMLLGDGDENRATLGNKLAFGAPLDPLLHASAAQQQQHLQHVAALQQQQVLAQQDKLASKLKRTKSASVTMGLEEGPFGRAAGGGGWGAVSFLHGMPTPLGSTGLYKFHHEEEQEKHMSQVINLLESPREAKQADVVTALKSGGAEGQLHQEQDQYVSAPEHLPESSGGRRLVRRATFSIFPRDSLAAAQAQAQAHAQAQAQAQAQAHPHAYAHDHAHAHRLTHVEVDERGMEIRPEAPEWTSYPSASGDAVLSPLAMGSLRVALDEAGKEAAQAQAQAVAEDGLSGGKKKPLLRRVNSAELVRKAFPEMLFDRSSPHERSEHNLDALLDPSYLGEGAPSQEQQQQQQRRRQERGPEDDGSSVALTPELSSVAVAARGHVLRRESGSGSVVSVGSAGSASAASSSTALSASSSGKSRDMGPIAPHSGGQQHMQRESASPQPQHSPVQSVSPPPHHAQQQQQMHHMRMQHEQQQQQQQPGLMTLDMLRQQQETMLAAMAAQAATATPQQLFEMQHQSMQLMLYMQQVAFAQLNPMAMHMQMNLNMSLNTPQYGMPGMPFAPGLMPNMGMGAMGMGTMGMGGYAPIMQPMQMGPMHGAPGAPSDPQHLSHAHQLAQQQQQQQQHGGQFAGTPQRAPAPSMAMPRSGAPAHHAQLPFSPAQALSSGLLAEHKHTGRKPSVPELRGHVVEFAKDSHGSRYLQELMNAATADEKRVVIDEVKGDCLGIIQDLFGNYVMQNFLDHASEEQRTVIANKMRGVLVELSMHPHGCRVVQKALDLIGPSEIRCALLQELILTQGNLELTAKDAHATHVLQKAVVVLQRDVYPYLERRSGRGDRFKKKTPLPAVNRARSTDPGQLAMSRVLLKAVEDVVADNVMALAVNQHACRLVQRVIGDCDRARSPCVSVMIDALERDYDNLARDQHGNFILQHILELGQQDQSDRIQDYVSNRVVELSQHKFGSHLVEKCLVTADPQRASLIVESLLRTQMGTLTKIMKDPYANFVLQRAYDVGTNEHRARIEHEVLARSEALSQTTSGRHILSYLGRSKKHAAD